MAKKQEKEFTQVIVRDEEGRKYTLQFNRRVVEAMEKDGIYLEKDSLSNMPVTTISGLVQGAFRMHSREHGKLSAERIMEIWDYQRNKEELLATLMKLYLQPVNDMMVEHESEDNTPTWETA